MIARAIASQPLTLQDLTGNAQAVLKDGITPPFTQLSFARASVIHPTDPNLIHSWVGWQKE